MKITVSVFIILFLFSCGQQKSQPKLGADPEKKSELYDTIVKNKITDTLDPMLKYVTVHHRNGLPHFVDRDSININSNGKNANTTVFGVSLDTIPKEWTLLTLYKGKKVIFQYCNVQVQKFYIYKEKNKWMGFFFWGLDGDLYTIVNVALDKKGLTFYLKESVDDDDFTTITILNYKTGLKSAIIQYEDYVAEFINENSHNNYELYIEPCD